MKIWKKFFNCECNSEGVTLSYETEEKGLPVIDLAFFQLGIKTNKELSFIEKIKWCWIIMKYGTLYTDMIMLNQDTAKELGQELLNFSKKKYKFS